MSGSDLKRWNWLEQGVVPLVSALMVAAWVRPLFQAVLSWNLVSPAGRRYPAWLIVAIPLGVAAIEGALRDNKRGRWWMLGASMLILLASLVVLTPGAAGFFRQPLTVLAEALLALGRFEGRIPASLLMLVMTALLILRGLRVDWMAHEALWRSFLMGVLVLGGLMLLPAAVSRPLALGSAVALFLLWGLLALALLAVASMLYTQRALGRKAPGLSRYWLVVVSVAVGVVVIVGWAAGLLLSPETVAEIAAWFNPIRRAIGQALQWFMTALIYVIFLVLEPLINWLRSLLAKRTMPKINLASPFAKQLQELQDQANAQPKAVPWGAIAAGAIGVIIIVALILAWRRRQRARIEPGVAEQREYIGSLDLLLSQLRDLLANVRRPRLDPFLDTLSTADPRHRIRLLYRRVLTAARAIQQPRLPGQTPSSYARRLARLHPARAEDLNTLTVAYHVARYAEEAPSPEAAARAEEATARIEQALIK